MVLFPSKAQFPKQTLRAQDPVTGKDYNREELTSVLRDTWENMIIQDVATAGGVSTRQVKKSGDFPESRSGTQRVKEQMAGKERECGWRSNPLPFASRIGGWILRA